MYKFKCCPTSGGSQKCTISVSFIISGTKRVSLHLITPSWCSKNSHLTNVLALIKTNIKR